MWCDRCLHDEEGVDEGGAEGGDKVEEGKSDSRIDIKHSSYKKVSTFLVR